ncbi:MAG TPA: CinA family protein [Herminiimonas sp.]|nr:CinA family protein [Herminiimonas sp.]
MEPAALNEVVRYLKDHQLKVVTAESCTAGLIASTLAELPGCGAWLECAFVTYSEDAKTDYLGVKQQTIEQYGLTSEEVASAMSAGALNVADANLALATTGVVGPSNGDGEEPVGTVCLAWSFKHVEGPRTFSEKRQFDGDRNAVRAAVTEYALKRIQHYHEAMIMQDPS